MAVNNKLETSPELKLYQKDIHSCLCVNGPRMQINIYQVPSISHTSYMFFFISSLTVLENRCQYLTFADDMKIK